MLDYTKIPDEINDGFKVSERGEGGREGGCRGKSGEEMSHDDTSADPNRFTMKTRPCMQPSFPWEIHGLYVLLDYSSTPIVLV